MPAQIRRFFLTSFSGKVSSRSRNSFLSFLFIIMLSRGRLTFGTHHGAKVFRDPNEGMARGFFKMGEKRLMRGAKLNQQ